MNNQHFKALAYTIATIDDLGERERMAQLIGKVCANFNENFSLIAWNEMCDVCDEFDYDYDYSDFDNYSDYDYYDAVHDYPDQVGFDDEIHEA